MSVLGPLSTTSLNLAASFTGTLRNPVVDDRAKADQATQKMHADVVQLSTPDLADTLESDLSHGQVADRDADGRLPWTFGQPPSEGEEDPPKRTPADGADLAAADGLGQTLDLNA